MAKEESFDVVSQMDMQEVDNAINQTNKEIQQRFDFKNSKAAVSLEEGSLKIIAEDEFKLRSAIDILQNKLIRRQVPIKNLEYGKFENATGGMSRQIVGLKQGIEADTARQIVKDIKSLKLKTQAQVMGDQIRVSGKSRDDLQLTIAFLKKQDYKLELQFINYR